MSLSRFFHLYTLVACACLMGAAGCTRDGSTEPAEFPTEGAVFLDEFASGVTFQAFLGSKLDAVDIDIIEKQSGSASLNVIVPDSGDPSGSYAGGAFTTGIGRNLSGFNALTFWAKASAEVTLNVAGIGNDNTGTSRYTAETNNLPLSTSWTKFIIPIPLPEKLTAEQGLFYFAEGPENGVGCQIWFDEIQFESVGAVASPAASLGTSQDTLEVGEVKTLGTVTVTFDVNGVPLTVNAMPGYLTFASSNSDVVSVGDYGALTALSVGTATVTAKLGTVDASGSVIITVEGADPVPTIAAPAPTVPSANVISLFSDAYTDVTVGSWSADWDMADISDEVIASDNVKKYSNLAYAGIEFASPTVDVSGMTRFHVDIWTPNPTTAPAKFKIKLVDFGANGVFGGGDDREHELIFDENTAPALASQTWVSLDVPLGAFDGLTTKAHLAQMIISGDLSTVYVDNVYFHDAGPQTAPTIPAPTPHKNPAMVISLLSDAYTNVTVDTWSTVWDGANVEDYMIGSDLTKKYTNLVLAAIECLSQPVDASDMTHFHIDLWTPDATSAPSVFKIKLVDLGANGTYGGGDDLEHELVFDQNTMNSYSWVSIDVPLANFTDLITRGHIGQIILSGNPNTVYVDNVYFYDSGLPTAPQAPAPAPTVAASDVISLFSDAYTNVPVDTWSAPWDTADVADYLVGSDLTKRYTNLLFAGIEFASATIDASAMTHFHMDVWTPDPTNAPAVFKIKLVDFGANGVWDGGGDDTEHELTLGESVMATGEWVSLDIPFSDFVNLTNRAHLAQMIISGDPNTVYVDNLYFHK